MNEPGDDVQRSDHVNRDETGDPDEPRDVEIKRGVWSINVA